MMSRLHHTTLATALSIASAAMFCTSAHATGDCISTAFGPNLVTGAPTNLFLPIYDSGRNVTVALSTDGDTFEFVNEQWVYKSSIGVVSLFSNSVMIAGAFRSASGQSVILDVQQQLLAWNGQDWTLESITPFSARSNVAMTYDSYRDVLIIFGGSHFPGVTNPTNELWEYDFPTETWTQIEFTGGPGPRQRAAMAFDLDRNVVVMFGGRSAAPELLNETWEYDPVGGAWTEIISGIHPTPPVRERAGLAYHQQLKMVMLSGGNLGLPGLDDIWLFDGDRWYERYPAGVMNGVRGPMVYDSASNVMRQHITQTGDSNQLVVHSDVAAPLITSQPENQVVSAGQPVQFAVAAIATPEFAPLAYQWRRNGQPIPGATLSAYTIFAAEPEHVGAYDCIVTYANHGDLHCGRAVSIAATLTIEAEPTCLGDLNNSGTVGVADLLILLGAWGPCP